MHTQATITVCIAGRASGADPAPYYGLWTYKSTFVPLFVQGGNGAPIAPLRTQTVGMLGQRGMAGTSHPPGNSATSLQVDRGKNPPPHAHVSSSAPL
jgi:hypothetical protein